MVVNPDKTEFDIFIGTRIGSFKHIKYHAEKELNTRKCIENLRDVSTLQKGDGIACMSWGGAEQTEIIIGRENRTVQCYDTITGTYGHQFTVESGKGPLVAACRIGRKLVTATSDGAVKMWGKKEKEMSVGEIDHLKPCPYEKGLFITGGKENDLKVWRMGTDQPVFSAKNVRNDWLELRCPIWATDVCFLGDSHTVASCSRYGTVRLYDTRAQRRPVCDVAFPNMAATCVSQGLGERQALVGFARGHLHNVDLRGRGRSDKGYKGSVGAVTAARLVPGTGYLVSAGLDRHVNVHRAETKELLYRQYLTSKLTTLLIQTAASTPLAKIKSELKEEPDAVDELRDMDEMFDDMETVGEDGEVRQKIKGEMNKRKRAAVTATVEIKSEDEDDKPEITGDDDEEDEAEVEDGIARLLKLTEKKKRKIEKTKKKKKAKSVFHNA